MAPRTEEEKAQRKAEFLKRKQEREKKKEQEAKAAAEAEAKKKEETQKKVVKSGNSSGISLLLDLPEDALKQVICELSAAELGRVSMTCKQMNRALCDMREAYLLSRLRHSRMTSLGPIEMCAGSEEANLMIKQSFGGGETGRLVVKPKGKNKNERRADEFVSYARFLNESVHGYLPFGFRVEGEKNKAFAPQFVNGRFVSASPEHSLIRVGGDAERCGAGGSGVGTYHAW